MTKTTQTVLRSLFTGAIAGLGLLFTVQPASADPMVFTVEEDPAFIPGVVDNTLEADKITSSYVESLVLSGNTFTADLVVTFNGYDLAGIPQPNQVGTNTPAGEALDPEDYGLYAEVTVTGTFSAAPDPSDANQTVFDFDPLTAFAEVFLNPDQNTATADSLILTASLINQLLSDGSVTTITSTGQVVGGTFTLVFLNAATQGLGVLYWPDFTGLVLTATATGDVDETSVVTFNPLTGQGQGTVTGEASINFEGQAVPEPASLSLFGMGLLGAGVAARRRLRKV